jgi:hypothetical protein
MKTFYRYLFALFIALAGSNVLAQNGSVLFSNSRNYTFNFNVNNLQGTPQITSAFINSLAAGVGRPALNVNYVISFDQTLELLLVNNFLQVNVANRFIQPTGDVYYRNFYVGDLLQPTSINAIVNVLDERGGILRSLQISNLNRMNAYSTFINTNLIPVGMQKSALQLVNMLLFYDAQALNDFNNRLALINDYYNSNMMLDNVQGQLASIAFVSPENIESATTILQQAEGIINQIELRGYASILQLASNDPINLMSRTAALRNILAQKRMSVNMAYASLDSYYYSKGMEALNNKSNSLALSFFNKSIAINPTFAPSAYQLAMMKFEEGNLIDADLKLREVWFNMNPEINTYQNSLTLFKNIYNEYLESGDQLANSGKYQDALVQYDRATKLCREINGVMCNEAAKIAVRNCHKAIYENMLNSAKKDAEAGNTVEAYNKFNKAKNYASDNQIDKRDRGMEETVDKALKLNEYKNAVADAKDAFSKKDFSSALAGFETAHELESKFGFAPSIIPLDTEQKSAREVLKLKLTDLNSLVDNNDWDALKTQLTKAEEMQAFYKLDGDKEITASIGSLKDKLKKFRCDQTQRKFQELVQKAKGHIASGNYILASDAYDNAIKMANENAECDIDYAQSAEEKSRFLAPATYQKFINKILDLQMNGSYAEAVAKYKEAQAYHVQFELGKFNLQKKSLFDFAKDNFKNAALNFVAGDFKKNGQIDEAFQLYKILIDRNYPVRNMSDDLFDLGKRFGTRDKGAGSSNYKVKVIDYVGNNKQLKNFKKGYISAFEN